MKAVFSGVAYMPVPRCEQCRWWTHDGPPTPLQIPEGLGCCHLIETVDYKPAQPRARAFVDVEGPGVSSLYTAPDFGCVQWEAKGKA